MKFHALFCSVGAWILLLLGESKATAPPGLLLWNTLDRHLPENNSLIPSQVGPPFHVLAWKKPLWQWETNDNGVAGEASFQPAFLGEGLYLNHGINRWEGDGATFAAVDLHAAGLHSSKRGTIELWLYQYNDGDDQQGIFVLRNELTAHYGADTGIYGEYPGRCLSNWPCYDTLFVRLSRWTAGARTWILEFKKDVTATMNEGPGRMEVNHGWTNNQVPQVPVHFALLWDVDGIDNTTDTLHFYINGTKLVSSTETWDASYTFPQYLYLGSNPNSGSYSHWYHGAQGVYDDIKVWNYAKTDFLDPKTDEDKVQCCKDSDCLDCESSWVKDTLEECQAMGRGLFMYAWDGKTCLPDLVQMVGDPHIESWRGEYFEYMGECDLLLVNAPAAGIRIHARTTIRHDYSYMEQVAIQIGADTLEVSSWGEHFFNGVDGAIPAVGPHSMLQTPPREVKLGGYPLIHTQLNKRRQQFDIMLGHGENITISNMKDIVSIKINHIQGGHFEDAVGLFGSYQGDMLARDGTTNLHDDINAMGQEWQVRDNEPMLFQSVRAPQYPQKCLLPDLEAKGSRRLGEGIGEEAAKVACAHLKHRPHAFYACVYDVTAMNDLDQAQDGAY